MANTTDALAALSLIADLVGESYKTRAEMQHDQNMLAKKAEIAKNQTLLAHNLRRYESVLDRRDEIADDLVEQGVTLKELDKLPKEQQTEGSLFQKESMKSGASVLDNTLLGIRKLNQEIKMLQNQKRDYTKGQKAYTMTTKEFDRDGNRYLDKDEVDTYFKSDQYKQDYTMESGKFNPETGEAQRVSAFTDPDAFRLGFESQIPDYKEALDIEAKEAELEKKAVTGTGKAIQPLSGASGMDAYKNPFSVESATILYAQWKEADFGTFEDLITTYSGDYTDLAKGVLDYSDIGALQEGFKRKAEEWAEIHGADAGLTLEDVDSKNEKYQLFEDRYVFNAMRGVKANPLYKGKDIASMQTLRTKYQEEQRKLYKAEFETIQGSQETLTKLIGSVDKKGKVSYTVPVNDLVKKAKAAGVTLSKEKVQTVYNLIMNNLSDEFARKMMSGDKTVQKVLKFIPGGSQMATLIEEAVIRIEAEYDPYQSVFRKGSKSKKKESDEYNKQLEAMK